MSTLSPHATPQSAVPAERAAPARSPARPAKAKRPATPRLAAERASREARRLAAAILEVLAGVRSPVDAAQQLDISLTRYYLDEGRALQGLVAACEPRPRGRVRTPESELAALRREGEQLRRQLARQQALVRVAQRAVGLAPAVPAAAPAGSGKKRRPRKPTARALQAAAVLHESDASAAAAAPSDNCMSP
jgi:hypothetical protein